MGSDFGSWKADLTKLNVFFSCEFSALLPIRVATGHQKFMFEATKLAKVGTLVVLALCSHSGAKAKCHSRGWLRFCFGSGEDSMVETGASVAF